MGSGPVSDGVLAEVPADAAVLIAGPPMTGKYELLLRLLQVHADTVIFITTKNGFERVREDYRAVSGSFDVDRFGIVDCVSYNRPVQTTDVAGPVKFAESPENLTRIGVKFTELYDQFQADPEAGTVGIGIHSLSQLLMHSEVRQVYQFLQVLVGQIRNAGHLAAAVIDVSSSDDETITTLQQHFDGLVTTRENDAGAREYRVRGLAPTASDWTTF